MTDNNPSKQDESLEQELDQLEEEVEQAEDDVAEEELDELQQAEAKAAEHWDRLLRLQAEMDNIKRRAQRDVANAHKFATENFVKALLPVVDSLEIALQNADQTDGNALREGLELTHKMFLDVMDKNQVKQIDPEGEPFDPELHEAMSMQESAEVESNSVLKVMQKGYTLNERLIRPALVIVSQ